MVNQKDIKQMSQTKHKKIKLDNGKTIIVDKMPNQNGRDPFKEAAKLLAKVPNIKPCD